MLSSTFKKFGAQQCGLLKTAVPFQGASFRLYKEITMADPALTALHFTPFLSSDVMGQGERWVNQPISPLPFLFFFFLNQLGLS